MQNLHEDLLLQDIQGEFSARYAGPALSSSEVTQQRVPDRQDDSNSTQKNARTTKTGSSKAQPAKLPIRVNPGRAAKSQKDVDRSKLPLTTCPSTGGEPTGHGSGGRATRSSLGKLPAPRLSTESTQRSSRSVSERRKNVAGLSSKVGVDGGHGCKACLVARAGAIIL